MRKLLYFVQIGIFTCLANQGCKLSETDKDVVVKIEPEFILGMNEVLGQTRNFEFTFKTVDIQTCQSNTISFTSSRNSRNLNLNLVEIMETADCQVGEGQVEDSASYDFLPLGVYNLELVLKNTVSSSGTLTVTNDKYTLEIEDGYGFMANEATLMRVPTESVWGYVAYKDNQHLTTADEFLSVLNLKTSNLKLGKGNYNYFSIGGNDKLSLDKAPDYNNFKTFYRKSTGQNTELIKLLEDYRTQYPSGEMEFKIFTSQGETL